MTKSPEAFRTISEVAEVLDVPAHVLRFWETRFAQVKPVKRGGGRRYYRPDDVRLLRGIRGLLYDDGMTIKGVQKILREHGVRHVIGLGTDEAAAAPEPAKPRAKRAPSRPAPRPAPQQPTAAAAGRTNGSGGQGKAAEPVGHGAQADLFTAGAAAGHGLATAEAAPGAAGDAAAHAAAGMAAEIAAEAAGESHAGAKSLDRTALRRLVGELEALRAVMADERRR
jgi:DNA-binding transcriptional MerR regulator